MFTDFLGQEITAGCWLATGGAGNGPAEYGMILCRVRSITDDKLRIVRLKVTYPNHRKAQSAARNSVIKNPNKYVVVQPSQAIIDLFERVVADKATKADQQLVGKWVHGIPTGLFT